MSKHGYSILRHHLLHSLLPLKSLFTRIYLNALYLIFCMIYPWATILKNPLLGHIMTDPLSVTTGIIAVAGLAYSSSKALYELILIIQDALQCFKIWISISRLLVKSCRLWKRILTVVVRGYLKARSHSYKRRSQLLRDVILHARTLRLRWKDLLYTLIIVEGALGIALNCISRIKASQIFRWG